MDWRAAAESVAIAAGALGAILSSVLALKAWAPQNRKLTAETRGTDASSTKVMSEATILWHDEFTREAAYTDALETALDEWRRWRGKVVIIIDAACPVVTLPPAPDTPKRPPRSN